MTSRAAVSVLTGIVACLTLTSRLAWATHLVLSAEFASLDLEQCFTQHLWEGPWPGAVWHWGLWQGSRDNDEGALTPGIHSSNKADAMPHASGVEGGLRFVLDVTDQKSSIPEDHCCSCLMALESSRNAWGHGEPATWAYQHCVGVGRKCSGEWCFSRD